MRCWGFGANGRLGYGSDDHAHDARRAAVALGPGPHRRGDRRRRRPHLRDPRHRRACAAGASAARGAWATPTSATVGEAPGTLPETAGPVNLGAGRTARAITLGGAPTPATPAAPDEGTGYTCALIDDGTLRCWGYGVDGRLGYGDEAQVAGTGFPSPAARGRCPSGPLAGSLADLSVGLAASAAQVALGGSAGPVRDGHERAAPTRRASR